MDTSQASTPVIRQSRRQRWFAWLFFLTILITAFGLIWWLSPKPYHLAAKFPVHASDAWMLPCDVGFLTRLPNDRLTLRDWHGQEIWTTRQALKQVFCHALSPNGRYLAYSADGVKVAVYRDGTKESTVAVPSVSATATHRLRFRHTTNVKVFNDGRVFVWANSGTICPVAVYQHGKELATGVLLPGTTVSLSPDGTAVAAGGYASNFEHAMVSIKDGKVVLSHRFTGSDILTPNGFMPPFDRELPLCVDGVVLTENGALYRKGKRVSGPSGWEHLSLTQNGRYTCEHKGAVFRVLSPVTGKSWQVRLKKELEGGLATDDGKHAFVISEAEPSKAITFLREKLPESLAKRFFPEYAGTISVYEQPGRLRARTRITNEGLMVRGVIYNVNGGLLLSPDGRTLVISAHRDDSGRNECLVLRW